VLRTNEKLAIAILNASQVPMKKLLNTAQVNEKILKKKLIC
jgi:hypothetical protein